MQGDLAQVLYPDLFRWEQGDATSLQRLLSDPDAIIISQGMREHLDLNLGDVVRVKGAGFDHERMMRIVAVAARVPGFGSQFTRSKNDAQGGGSAIFMNLETYRELKNDPDKGVPDETQGLLTRLMATVQPGVDDNAVANAMREYLANESGMNITRSKRGHRVVAHSVGSRTHHSRGAYGRLDGDGNFWRAGGDVYGGDGAAH